MVLVFIVPNLCPCVAAQVVRVPPGAALVRDIQYATSEERDALGRAASEKIREKYGIEVNLGDVASPELKHRLAIDSDFRLRYEQLRTESEEVWNEVNRKQEAKADRLREAWRSKADRQFALSRQLSYASPLPPFAFAATELTLTGFKTSQHFNQQVVAYYQDLDKYLWARYHEEQRRNPARSVDDFLDVSSRPRSTYVPPVFQIAFRKFSRGGAMLVGWNLALLAVESVGFLRLDVR